MSQAGIRPAVAERKKSKDLAEEVEEEAVLRGTEHVEASCEVVRSSEATVGGN